MITFQNLAEPLQNFLIDPRSSVFVFNFLKQQKKDTPEKVAKVSDLINDCIYGEISMDEMMDEIDNFCEFNDIDSSRFFQEFLELLGEEGLDELEKYSFNVEQLPVEHLFEKPKKESLVLQDTKELDRNPKVVRSKLLQVLAPFNLHVDEEGIVAHEVERYLRGEVFAKDLVPHLSALLDKPLSEINTLVQSLNESIFKPIQKQIAEEGTLDISYDNDATLHDFLVIQKKKGPVSSTEDVRKRIKNISFIPKEILKNVSKQGKEDVAFDLRAQGGTPNGTSLLSQEIQREQSIQPKKQQKEAVVAKIPKYTVDPYRENVE